MCRDVGGWVRFFIFFCFTPSAHTLVYPDFQVVCILIKDFLCLRPDPFHRESLGDFSGELFLIWRVLG